MDDARSPSEQEPKARPPVGRRPVLGVLGALAAALGGAACDESVVPFFDARLLVTETEEGGERFARFDFVLEAL